MKLRQVEFVLAIAETGSFSAAAARCNATQPTLSNALAQLEAELGGRLFARTTRQVELTPFGRHMLPGLQALIDARNEVTRAAEGYHNPQQKMLRIGLSPLVDMRMVTMLTDPFCRLHDGVEVFYKECLLDDLDGRLKAGAIDLAVLPRDVLPGGVEQLAFYTDPLLYLPEHGAGPPPPAVLRLADLPPAPVIMTGGGCGLNASLEALFAADGAPLPRYPGYATSYQVIQEWTWLGIGAGILPEAKLSDPTITPSRLIRNDGQPAEFAFCCAWRREAAAIGHVAAFIEHLRFRGPKLVAGQEKPVAV